MSAKGADGAPGRRGAGASRASSLVLGALLLLALGVTAALAYEAHTAAESHRETAERALRDYASVAAWEMVAALGETLDALAAPALGVVTTGKAASPFEPLADPKLFAAGAQESCPDGGGPTVLAVDLRNSDALAGGAALAPATVTRLRDAIVADVRTSFRQERGYALLLADGLPPIAYGVRVAEHGAPLAAYATTLCASTLGRRLVAPALRRRALLPWDVTGGVPTDSLLVVAVTDARGRPVWRSNGALSSPFSGQATAERVGGMHVAVALRPTAIARLRIGPPPGSRLPLLVTLLVTTVGLFGVAVLQLRREQELARMRNDFVAGVSHELRTPLAQIMLFAETLRLGRARSESERRQAADIIVQEGQRLMQLVENVLHFARAERGLPPVAGTPIELAPVVEETIARFAPLAAAAEVRLEWNAERGVPVVADPAAVRQILLNLLDNAVKHGGSNRTVTVSLARSGRDACLTVDDEGPGLRAPDRERVWLPFVRTAAGSETVGSGLGLSVVRELVMSMGGTTRVEEAPRGGARFVVSIPLADPARPGSAPLDGRTRRARATTR
ncbi:MAG TPA: HAMP domain-containing sensor histidine kinase [Gemmatimonadaceae bacterium]|nr:HAMP domain-containing sensor histidine kinase [Gemmatimonadaceae bacterium]